MSIPKSDLGNILIDDVYIDPREVKAKIVKVNGQAIEDKDSSFVDGSEVGEFERVKILSGLGSATAEVQDTINPIKVSLTATDATENEAAVYTATLKSNGNEVIANNDITVTLDNGEKITIQAGHSTGTYSYTQGDDVYKDGESKTLKITGVSEENSDQPGALESLVIDDDNKSATAKITDTIDTTKVSLTATESTSEDGGKITYTATLTDADGNEVKDHDGVTVKLQNGETINIEKNSASGSVTIDVNQDDVYLEPDAKIENHIVSATESDPNGKKFEKLVPDPTVVSTKITDDEDPVRVDLSTSYVDEDDGHITFTATLSAKSHGETVVNTNWGDITIADGQTQGELSIDRKDSDVYVDPEAYYNAITKASGGSFEKLVIGNDATAHITDTIDTTSLSISAEKDQVSEDTANSNFIVTLEKTPHQDVVVNVDIKKDGQKIETKKVTFAKDTTELTKTISVATQDSDVYNDSQIYTAEIASFKNGTIESDESLEAKGTQKGEFEKLVVADDKKSANVEITDTKTTVSVDLSTSDVTEDDDHVTFTATLSAKSHGTTVVKTELGDITIENGQTTGTLTKITKDSDIYVDPTTLSNKITEASGGNFEELTIRTASATAHITDTINPITVTLVPVDAEGKELSASEATEGQTAYYKVVAEDDAGNDITDGTVDVKFTGLSTNDYAKSGQTIESVRFGTIIDTSTVDDYIADDGETFTVSLVDGTVKQNDNKTYEQVHQTSSVTTTIKDNNTPVTLKIVPVDENGNLTTDDQGNPISNVVEGEKAYYKAILVDGNGKEIEDDGTVNISFMDGSALGSSDASDTSKDYINTPKTVKLGDTFSVDTIDNVYKEDDEIFTVKGDADSFSNKEHYEKVQSDPIETTITDDLDPINLTLTPTVKDTSVTIQVALEKEAKLDTQIKLNQKDADGKDIVIKIPAGQTSATTTVTMIPGEYELSVADVDGYAVSDGAYLGDTKDEYEKIVAQKSEKFQISIDLAPVCTDVKEDEDICEEGNLFVGEKKYDLRIEDDRLSSERGDDEGPLMTLQGTYGVLVLNTQTGDYKYTLDNDAQKVQEMNEDELIEEKFEVKVTNNRGFEGKKDITVKIHGTNDIPVAHDDTASLGEDDAPITIDVLANDTDVDSTGAQGETFSIDSIDPVEKGFAKVVDGKIVFDPRDDFNHLKKGESEQVKIHYTMSDERGASSNAYATVTVTGTEGNSCPLVVVDDCTYVKQGGITLIDVLGNDSGSDLKITDVQAPAHGTAEIVGDQIRYTSNPIPTTTHTEIDEDTGNTIEVKDSAPIGNDYFSYTVTDAFGASKSATVHMHISETTGARDSFVGGDGTDFIVAGEGNDFLNGAKGDDIYFFSKGDGHDTILDMDGMNDRIDFTSQNESNLEEKMTFKLEKDGDLVIGNGSGDTITVKYQQYGSEHADSQAGIERIEIDNSHSYLREGDIDKIIQTLSAYQDQSFDLAQINDKRHDNSVAEIVWHHSS